MYQTYKDYAGFNGVLRGEWTFENIAFNFDEILWSKLEYELLADTPLFADDYPGDISTTGVLVVGGGLSGTGDFLGDTDWFAVDLVAGEEVRFVTNISYIGLALFDSNGNELVMPTDSSNDQTGYFELLANVGISGVYYIQVSPGQIDYNLGAALTSSDAAGDISTQFSLTANGVIAGAIDASGDTDWYAIDLVANGAVAFNIGIGQQLKIFDAAGTLLGSSYDVYSQTFLNFAANITGTYYIEVSQNHGGGLDPYVLQAEEIPDDYAGNISTLGALTAGVELTASSDYNGDHDWFSITLIANALVLFTIDPGPYPSTFLNLYDSNGNLVTPPNGVNANTTLDYTASETGTYYIGINFVAGGDPPFSYTVLAETVQDDYLGNTSTIGTINSTGVTTGRIDYESDTDWFAFDATAGVPLGILIEKNGQNGRFYNVYDENGNIVYNYTTVINSTTAADEFLLVFEATNTGQYFLEIAGNESNPDYQVSIIDNVDDYSGSTTTMGVLSTSHDTDGVINYTVSGGRSSDSDWFALPSVPGALYQIEVSSTYANNFNFSLRDANGDQVVYLRNSAFGTDSVWSFAVPADGDYYIALDFGANGVNYTTYPIPYTLTLTEIIDDFGAGTNTNGAIAPNSAINGQINAYGDTDWLSFSMTGGDAVHFSLSGNIDISDYDLNIYDVNGTLVIDGAYDVLTAQHYFQAQTSGTYFVEIVTNALQGNYTLERRDYSDLYSNDVTTNGAISLGSDIVAELGTVADQDWFKFTASAGDNLQILLQEESPYHLHYSIYDDTGTVVFDTNGAFQVLVSGTYFIGVSYDGISYFNHGAPTQYQLSLFEPDNALYLGPGDNTYDGSETGDVVNGIQGRDIINGAGGDDVLRGGSGDDVVNGDAGNDSLYGDLGNDVLNGGIGNDTLNGFAGDDIISGGQGNDEMYGGAGSDTFVIMENAGDDRILDFEAGVDRIEYRDGPYSYSQLKIHQVGNDVVIYSANGVTTLVNTNIADIGSADFTFRLVPEEYGVETSKPIVSEVPETTEDKTTPVMEVLDVKSDIVPVSEPLDPWVEFDITDFQHSAHLPVFGGFAIDGELFPQYLAQTDNLRNTYFNEQRHWTINLDANEFVFALLDEALDTDKVSVSEVQLLISEVPVVSKGILALVEETTVSKESFVFIDKATVSESRTGSLTEFGDFVIEQEILAQLLTQTEALRDTFINVQEHWETIPDADIYLSYSNDFFSFM